MLALPITFFFFFFNDTATTEIYTLSLHDALPISRALALARRFAPEGARVEHQIAECPEADTLLREREQHHSREHHDGAERRLPHRCPSPKEKTAPANPEKISNCFTPSAYEGSGSVEALALPIRGSAAEKPRAT